MGLRRSLGFRVPASEFTVCMFYGKLGDPFLLKRYWHILFFATVVPTTLFLLGARLRAIYRYIINTIHPVSRYTCRAGRNLLWQKLRIPVGTQQHSAYVNNGYTATGVNPPPARIRNGGRRIKRMIGVPGIQFKKNRNALPHHRGSWTSTN